MKINKKLLFNILLCLLISALLIGIDQITKTIVLNKRETINGYIPVIKNFIGITYHENQGAAWGIFSGKKWLLIIITFVAFGMFGYMMKYFDLKKYPLYSVALTLLISGTIGNFIDRIFRTGVIDFIKTLFVDFPIFNFADMCLTCGVACIIIDMLFGPGKEIWKK